MIRRSRYVEPVTAGDDVAAAISASGFSIYDDLSEHPDLFYDNVLLEARLDAILRGEPLGYPLRTRSKYAKALVAAALGYPIPAFFSRTNPRFPGQRLDVFAQKALNLQVWNQDIDPTRRYVILRLDVDDVVHAVRVLTGEALALLDRTGTLTTKYQAARRRDRSGSTLVIAHDTDEFHDAIAPREWIPPSVLRRCWPTQSPERGQVLTIAALYERLLPMVGQVVHDPGVVSDRLRGVEVQRLACTSLGLGPYADTGRFPDILSQVLELKLQLSPTIDLGLVLPSSTSPVADVGHGVRHADCRYAIFYASRVNVTAITLDALVMTTGQEFFDEFRQFEGLVRNAKLQIGLPQELFEPEGRSY